MALRVVAWSLKPDADFESAAAAWARRNAAIITATISEEETWVRSSKMFTRTILGHLEIGIDGILTADGQLDHPDISDLRAQVEKEGLEVFDCRSGLLPPRPKKSAFRPVPCEEAPSRSLRGRVEGARSGRHQSGPVPFGYQRGVSQRRRGRSQSEIIAIRPGEAEVVRLIFHSYLRLRSLKKVIALLAEKGIRTRRRKSWSRAGISWIIKNKTYLGRVHFGPVEAQGQHPAIISPIIFNKAGALLRKNKKGGRRKKSPEGN